MSAPIEPDALYTPEEAAAYLRIHVKTVYRNLRLGLIPAKCRFRRWRIRGSELLKLA